MIIKLDELRTKPNQRQEFEFTTESVADLKLITTLSVEGEVKYVGDEIFVKGNYKVEVATPCVKCLKEVHVKIDGEFDGHYGEGEAYKEHISSLKKECEIKDNYLDEAKDGEIDITNLVREFIILDMPPYPACEPECDGLEEMEKYADDGIDLRWQELLNFNK